MPHSKERTVLVVEDEPPHMKLAVKELKKALPTAVLVKAGNGREAMELLEGGLRPDLIILDLKMPIMDGWEFLEARRDSEVPHLSVIPTIVLSTSNEDKDVLAAHKLHANSYIQKPIKRAAFEKAVETLACYWLKTALLPKVLPA